MIDQQPDVIPQVISQGMTGLQAVGGILSGILLIFIAAKPLLSKLRVGSAMDNAQIDAIERLSKLLNEERELRRQADNFVELDALREIIGRPPRETRDPAEPAPAVEA